MTEQPHLNSIETTIAEARVGDTNVEEANPSDTPDPNKKVSDTNASNWRDTLPDELKNAPSLAKFKDEASCIKAYLEIEKIFPNRIAIPKDDATEAEWDTFYKKIGRPEDKRYRPDNLPIGEDEEPVLARYEEILHKSGLTRKQGEKVLNHMIELSAQMDSEAKTREETTRSENLTILEKTFGDQMDLKMKQIQAALGQFGNPELAALVEQTSYHPALVQFLSSVGEKFASDRLVTGDSPTLPTSRQTALDEIKRLEMDEAFQLDYRGNDFEKRQEAIKKMDGLHKIAQQTSDV